MSADQAKFVHQLIPVINAFLHPVDECEEETHAWHAIGRPVSEAVKRWLTGRS